MNINTKRNYMKQALIFCITLLFISFQDLYSQTPGDISDIIGTSAPDFEVTDMNGNLISSKESAGKVLVLSFGFTTCKHFVGAIPDLNQVYEKYRSNPDVVFAAIMLSKNKDVIPFLEKYPINYPVVSAAREICDLFKVQGYPTIVVIDKNGKYLYYHSGDSPQIGQHVLIEIEAALQGK
jgi:cytochrome oxidase Cu insertion factor (SCO1/SenC/PrrC family)